MSNVVDFPAGPQITGWRDGVRLTAAETTELACALRDILGVAAEIEAEDAARAMVKPQGVVATILPARSNRDTGEGKGRPARADGGEGEQGCPTG